MSLPRPTALAILVLAAGSLAGAQGGERHAISGNTVAIYNLAGHVDIVAGTGSEVAVNVTRGGSDARKLRLEKGTRDGVNDLRVVYPDDDIVYPALGRSSNSTVSYSRDGYFNGSGENRWNHIRVRGTGSGTEAWADLRVDVPAGKQVTMNLAVGEVVATNVKGRLRIDVGAARVRARGHEGQLSIEAGSGSLTVEFLNSPKSLTVDTGSGGATLTFPASLSAEIEVETGSGGITNDFALTVTRLDRRSLRGKIGSGDGRITIETGSGGVRLRKGGA